MQAPSPLILADSTLPISITEIDGISAVIAAMLLQLFVNVAVVYAGCTIAIEVFLRYFDIMRLMCMGPIALSTIAGGSDMENTAISWIKAFLASVFDLVLIALTLRIGSLMIMSLSDVFPGSWLLPIANIILMITISGAVRSADKLLQHVFGL